MSIYRKKPVIIEAFMLNERGLVAEDCIFFDDSRENCEAAASLGIAAHQMTRNAAWPQWLIE